jgi:tetratricopeptide (TPR) repeat protein
MQNPMKNLLMLGAIFLVACTTTMSGSNSRVDFDSHLLLAEISREKQEFQQAAEHYLTASLMVEDPGLARLTTELAQQLGLNEIGTQAAQRWQELRPDDTNVHQYLGVFKLRADDREGAFEEFKVFVNEAGSTAAALARSVELLANESDEQSATYILGGLVELHPDIAEGHYGLARLSMRANNFAAALANAERAATLKPNWVEAQLLYARSLLIAGRIEEGLSLAERLIEEDTSLEVRLEYAELLLSAGNGIEAKKLLDTALTENPGLPEAVRALAFLTLTQNELEESKGHFNALRSNAQYRNEAFYYLGRIAELEEQYLQAMRSYSRVTEGNNAAEAQLRAARLLYLNLSDQEGALQHLREFGIANQSYNSEMLVGQSEILVQLDRKDDAMQLLTGALEDNPNDEALQSAQIQLQLIRTQDAIDEGNYGTANRILGRALHNYPMDTSLRYAQALLYQEQNRFRRAAATLESLVNDHPNDAGLLNALGYLLTDQMDRHVEAHGYLQKALATEPDNPAIIDSMGWVLFKLGEYEKALNYLERAFEMFPDPEVAAHIVDVQWALGNKEQAQEIFQEFLEQHPDSPHLQELGQRLVP